MGVKYSHRYSLRPNPLRNCFLIIIQIIDDQLYMYMYFIVCDDLSNLANGNVIKNGRKVGDTARYYCNYGYYLIGNDIVTCKLTGNWSGPPPICEG